MRLGSGSRGGSARARRAPRVGLAAVTALLAVGGIAAAAASKGADTAAKTALERRLDAVVSGRSLRGSKVGALVVRERDGRVLYAHEPDRRLIPASNTKVLTGLAALANFGPTHHFETIVRSERLPDDEGRVRTLFVRGGGDPVLNNEDWWRLAEDLRRTGLRHVTGDLVLDDTLFEERGWHPTWGRIGSRAYHAPVGALNANYGTFVLTVRPGPSEGAPAIVDVSPPVDYLRVVNRATTQVAGRSGLRLRRHPVKGADELLVDGSLRPDDPPISFYRSVSDATLYAGSVLRHQLEAVGIRVDGKVREGPATGGSVLLRFEGRQLSEIVRLFMKHSNNMVAEALVKNMAVRQSPAKAGEHAGLVSGSGNWSAGVARMREVLLGLGLDPQSFTLVDGSGLSKQNRISPRALVRALNVARSSFDFGSELVTALPIGNRDGTLAKRAKRAKDRVRAKTGLLDRVTALSGVAKLPDGETALFAILTNDYRVGDSEAMRALDAFVAELVAER